METGRNGNWPKWHGPKRLWTKVFMGRNDRVLISKIPDYVFFQRLSLIVHAMIPLTVDNLSHSSSGNLLTSAVDVVVLYDRRFAFTTP